jgi:glycosyltransferase involved in cell wall biosynthesis
MIVRDESHILREALDSAARYIDYWVIVDTGSTDDTRDVVRTWMAARGVPGDLHERPWRDFGSNRTEALELCAGRGDYAFVLDADDLVVGDLNLTRLVADSYLLRYGPDVCYWRKQLFRIGLRWRYVGAVHEYPACDDPYTEARLDGGGRRRVRWPLPAVFRGRRYVATRHASDLVTLS